MKVIGLFFLFALNAGSIAADIPANAVERKIKSIKLIGVRYPLSASIDTLKKSSNTRITLEVFKRMGVTVDMQYFPVARSFASLESGAFQAMRGVRYVFSPEVKKRLKLVSLSEHYVSAYYYSDKEMLITDQLDKSLLINKRIAGSARAWHDKVDELTSTYHVVPDVEKILDMLALGRLDFGLIGDNVGDQLIRDQKAGDQWRYFKVKRPISISKSGVVFDISQPGVAAIADTFESTLLALWSGPVVSEIVASNSDKYRVRFRPFPLLGYLD